MIRAGLFLYDYLARRDTLPASRSVDLRAPPYHDGLKPGLRKGFIYSDCWGDDARLVIANARAAADLGATIMPRTACVAAVRERALWRATLQPEAAAPMTVTCRALINVSGPWAKQFLSQSVTLPTPYNLKLVKGSHIIVPRLYSGDHAFILQNDDRRVIFVYPYEDRYTLIGTTDVEHTGAPGACAASAEEIAYLCRAANRYFARTLAPADVVWSFCGIRPLFDDGAKNASHITRDYTLRVDGDASTAPVLSVYGGKITTYRTLAEHALEQLESWFPAMKPAWTAATRLPGGNLEGLSLDQYAANLAIQRPRISPQILQALVSRHGSAALAVIGEAQTTAELGYHFGHTLYAREVNYFVRQEWAHSADDVLWRRSKCGLHINSLQKQILTNYLRDEVGCHEG
jgi:glycerol-3-phosphate dehydrogenase